MTDRTASSETFLMVSLAYETYGFIGPIGPSVRRGKQVPPGPIDLAPVGIRTSVRCQCP